MYNYHRNKIILSFMRADARKRERTEPHEVRTDDPHPHDPPDRHHRQNHSRKAPRADAGGKRLRTLRRRRHPHGHYRPCQSDREGPADRGQTARNLRKPQGRIGSPAGTAQKRFRSRRKNGLSDLRRGSPRPGLEPGSHADGGADRQQPGSRKLLQVAPHRTQNRSLLRGRAEREMQRTGRAEDFRRQPFRSFRLSANGHGNRLELQRPFRIALPQPPGRNLRSQSGGHRKHNPTSAPSERGRDPRPGSHHRRKRPHIQHDSARGHRLQSPGVISEAHRAGAGNRPGLFAPAAGTGTTASTRAETGTDNSTAPGTNASTTGTGSRDRHRHRTRNKRQHQSRSRSRNRHHHHTREQPPKPEPGTGQAAADTPRRKRARDSAPPGAATLPSREVKPKRSLQPAAAAAEAEATEHKKEGRRKKARDRPEPQRTGRSNGTPNAILCPALDR